MADCIFCKIAQKEIPSQLVYEDEQVVAFKDLEPQAPVHVLIIPKKHVESIMALKAEDKDLVSHILIMLSRSWRKSCRLMRRDSVWLPIRATKADRASSICISTSWAAGPCSGRRANNSY